MQVQSLGWKDPLEKEMATYSSILAWEILSTKEARGPQSLGLQKSWTIKKAVDWRTDTFKLWCWRRPLSPLESKIKPVNLKKNQPWILFGRTDIEVPILWQPDAKSWLVRKYLDAGKYWRQKEKRVTEDEMIGWHHRLEQLLGDGERQGRLECCSPWGDK